MTREAVMLVAGASLLAVSFCARCFGRGPLEQRSDVIQLNGQSPNPRTLLPWQQGRNKLGEFHGRLHVFKRVYPLNRPTRAVRPGSFPRLTGWQS